MNPIDRVAYDKQCVEVSRLHKIKPKSEEWSAACDSAARLWKEMHLPKTQQQKAWEKGNSSSAATTTRRNDSRVVASRKAGI